MGAIYLLSLLALCWIVAFIVVQVGIHFENKDGRAP